MELNSIEETIIKKAISDSGWIVNSVKDNYGICLFKFLFSRTSYNQKIVKTNIWTLTVLLKRAAELYSSLPDNSLEQYKKKLETISNGEIEKTEAERLIRERVGQDVYRNALLKYWDGACSVTRCTLKAALRDSHSKPWKDCTRDAESHLEFLKYHREIIFGKIKNEKTASSH